MSGVLWHLIHKKVLIFLPVISVMGDVKIDQDFATETVHWFIPRLFGHFMMNGKANGEELFANYGWKLPMRLGKVYRWPGALTVGEPAGFVAMIGDDQISPVFVLGFGKLSKDDKEPWVDNGEASFSLPPAMRTQERTEKWPRIDVSAGPMFDPKRPTTCNFNIINQGARIYDVIASSVWK